MGTKSDELQNIILCSGQQFMQRKKQDTPVPLLMQALGHATQRQTMEYLCIQEKEIENVYTAMEL